MLWPKYSSQEWRLVVFMCFIARHKLPRQSWTVSLLLVALGQFLKRVLISGFVIILYIHTYIYVAIDVRKCGTLTLGCTWVLENSRLYECKVAAIWFEPTMSWLVDLVLTFNLWTSGRIWSSSLCYENDEHVPDVYQENEEITTKSCF